MLFNFLVLVLFVIPQANRLVDQGFKVLRSLHLEEPVGYSLQIWLIGSSLAAPVLLGQMLWQRRRRIAAGFPSVSLMLEIRLVTSWWVAVLCVCVWAFALGTGG